MIITVPHTTLRSIAAPINNLDESVMSQLGTLRDTLVQKDNPKGVGLSAPQINWSSRAFVTLLDADSTERSTAHPILRTFINPQVISASKEKTLGENPAEPILEGCLSIPGLYGPVPRHQWIEFQWQEIEADRLITKYETFYGFSARVMQHEFDHLEGTLFTDYTLSFDLPLYEDINGKMKRIKSSIAKKF